MFVQRFDVATLGNAERTPQGFLKIPAYLTRVGVLEYKRADGTIVRELRPRDEVFKADSLATLSAAPVTDLHPTEMVTPKNVRQLQIGHVSEQVRADGALVAGHVTVQDENAIAAVQAGKRHELSCGYACRIDATPGIFEGKPYDQVQRDITYNHVAIGPKNWGRAGRDVALRVDSAEGGDADKDVFRLDEADALSVAIVAPPDRGGNPMPVTIHVDGVDVEIVEKQGAQVIEKSFATIRDALGEALAKCETLQGRADASDAKAVKLEADLAAERDPKRKAAAVAERMALEKAAGRVLPADFKYDGLTTRQIQEAVLAQVYPTLEVKERSDEYIGARFDGAVEESKDGKRSSNLDDARRLTSLPAKRADAKEPPVPDWQKPLSYTRARTKVI